MDTRKKLANLDEHAIASMLLTAHCNGEIHNKNELCDSTYHMNQSLNFAQLLIGEIEGTDEEKLNFIEKVREDLGKFKVIEG